jgi:NOL1/NOP2/fmu family ribosome biogenesis protein
MVDDTGLRENVAHEFDRLPETDADREVSGRPSREAVVDWWADRFAVPSEVFDEFTFWEKGKGRVWALAYDLDGPVAVESLGLPFLRVRQEHWKPTTEAVQRFGKHATRNVLDLDEADASAFLAGETTDPDWAGDWGYLVVRHDIAGGPEPIGVGLYVHHELRSMIPKGRRRDFNEV